MSALDGASLKPLISAAYATLGPVAEMDGRVLYSSIETLCPGRLYLMGLNPGAGQDRYHHIGASLLDIPNHHWNTYIDDDWGPGIGMHHTQKRVCYMLQTLGLAPRAVFATNLVFARSRSWTATQASLIPTCLRVHRMFLEIIQPRTVLTFGKEAFDALTKVGGHNAIEAFDTGCPNGRANFSCYATESNLFGRTLRVVCTPHLSKFKIDAQPRTTAWLREAAS